MKYVLVNFIAGSINLPFLFDGKLVTADLFSAFAVGFCWGTALVIYLKERQTS